MIKTVHELILELAKCDPTAEVSMYVTIGNRTGSLSGILDITNIEEDGKNVYVQSEMRRELFEGVK